MLHILVVYGVIKQINNQDNSYIVPFITVTIHMPKAGFKSITVSETVYNKFFDVYELSRKDLELKGITSFSGYLTSMMEEMMIKYEAFAKHAPFIQKIAIDQNRIILKDNKCNRIVEVLLKDRELQCLLDEKSDCVHVGFVYSLPELYSIISNKAFKAHKM
ncbi:MAG: hypothetical protein WCC17_03020 [Candidatus Nitrosopolaris sp.]